MKAAASKQMSAEDSTSGVKSCELRIIIREKLKAVMESKKKDKHI